MVVLSLSSVPEATGSRVHDMKNMHMLLPCSRPIFCFRSFSFLLVSSVFFLIAFLLLLLVPVLFLFYIIIATWFFCTCKFHVDFVSIVRNGLCDN